jgi:hypothetical protein
MGEAGAWLRGMCLQGPSSSARPVPACLVRQIITPHCSDRSPVARKFLKAANTGAAPLPLRLLPLLQALASGGAAERMAVAARVGGDRREAAFWAHLPATLAAVKAAAGEAAATTAAAPDAPAGGSPARGGGVRPGRLLYSGPAPDPLPGAAPMKKVNAGAAPACDGAAAPRRQRGGGLWGQGLGLLLFGPSHAPGRVGRDSAGRPLRCPGAREGLPPAPTH